ncbi:MAG: hypothetical protein ACXW3Z_04235 [Limisphaerales bacterium]
MIVNLENVSYVTVSGMRLELHFKDSSSYMNRFSSVGEMLAALKDWQEKTRILHGECLRPDIDRTAAKRKTPAPLRAKKLPVAAARP